MFPYRAVSVTDMDQRLERLVVAHDLQLKSTEFGVHKGSASVTMRGRASRWLVWECVVYSKSLSKMSEPKKGVALSFSTFWVTRGWFKHLFSEILSR